MSQVVCDRITDQVVALADEFADSIIVSMPGLDEATLRAGLSGALLTFLSEAVRMVSTP